MRGKEMLRDKKNGEFSMLVTHERHQVNHEGNQLFHTCWNLIRLLHSIVRLFMEAERRHLMEDVEAESC